MLIASPLAVAGEYADAVAYVGTGRSWVAVAVAPPLVGDAADAGAEVGETDVATAAEAEAITAEAKVEGSTGAPVQQVGSEPFARKDGAPGRVLQTRNVGGRRTANKDEA